MAGIKKKSGRGRLTAAEEAETQRWLDRFSPKARDFYDDIFSKKPRGLTAKDWVWLKFQISKVVLNKLIPDKKEIGGSEEKPLRMKIEFVLDGED